VKTKESSNGEGESPSFIFTGGKSKVAQMAGGKNIIYPNNLFDRISWMNYIHPYF